MPKCNPEDPKGSSDVSQHQTPKPNIQNDTTAGEDSEDAVPNLTIRMSNGPHDVQHMGIDTKEARVFGKKIKVRPAKYGDAQKEQGLLSTFHNREDRKVQKERVKEPWRNQRKPVPPKLNQVLNGLLIFPTMTMDCLLTLSRRSMAERS